MQPPPRTHFFGVLDQLRAVAALVVVYAHLVGNFLAYRGRSWVANDQVTRFVEHPLAIVDRFGWIGVCLFFLVSGIVITHVATRESGAEFVVKRVLRIYPPVIATVILVMVLANLGVLSVGLYAVPTIGEAAIASSLVGWLLPGQPGSGILVVGWTLVIELFFYLAMWATRPLLARVPAAVPAIILSAVLVVCTLPLGQVSGYASYVPILVIGQILYLVYTKRMGPLAGAGFLAAAWVTCIVAAERGNPALANNGLLPNTAIAVLVVVIALLLEGRVRPNRVVALIARRSYSLYLVHVPVGFSIAFALDTRTALPYTVTLLIALAGTALATELLHRLVELPSVRLGSRLGRRLRGRVPRASALPSGLK